MFKLLNLYSKVKGINNKPYICLLKLGLIEEYVFKLLNIESCSLKFL